MAIDLGRPVVRDQAPIPLVVRGGIDPSIPGLSEHRPQHATSMYMGNRGLATLAGSLVRSFVGVAADVTIGTSEPGDD